MKKIFAVLILATILFMEAGFVLAQTDPCADYCSDPANKTEPAGYTCICSPIKYKSVSELVRAITNWIFWTAVIVAPLMIVVGAFMFLTSAGNPTRVGIAKNIMLWTSVGLAIIIGSKLLIALIRRILGA